MTDHDLLQVVRDFGSPVYVYNAHKMEAQYKRLTKAFDKVKSVKIHYAVKALSNPNVLRYLHQLGASMDTVSLQEVRLALNAGIPASEIIYTPNGVSMQEYEDAAALGVQLNIDNLATLEDFGTRHPEVPVCIITGRPELRRLIYERAKAQPPDGYPNKPVTAENLVRNVRKILDMRTRGHARQPELV